MSLFFLFFVLKNILMSVLCSIITVLLKKTCELGLNQRCHQSPLWTSQEMALHITQGHKVTFPVTVCQLRFTRGR